MARATATDKFISEKILSIQKQRVTLMGELAVLPEDLPRYTKDGFALVTADMAAPLEKLVKEIEAQNVSFKGWATPGATQNSAALDMARTICRRAERRVCDLNESGELSNPEIIIFLNRLSDLLWLFARWEETE
jgi:cob(I)alamin adenosyltransferase